jgi:DivIVA domain-containing protein
VTIFLVILAILLMGGTAVLASGRALPAPFGQIGAVLRAAPSAGSGSTAVPPHEGPPALVGTGLVEPVASLPPVLLPDVPSAQDVDAVRFGLGLRGYRMDQVDEVLDRLAVALEERDAVIRDLQSRLAAGDAG